MKALALDPSSTRTGYAVAEGPGELLEAGALAPKRSADAVERIKAMVQDLDELIEEHQPDVVIVEVPDGKVHGRRKHAGGAGLSVYGMAAGAMLDACWRSWGIHVHAVTPTQWNRGRSKNETLAIVDQVFPGTDWKKDRGRDASDAAGELVWWFEEQEARA